MLYELREIDSKIIILQHPLKTSESPFGKTYQVIDPDFKKRFHFDDITPHSLQRVLPIKQFGYNSEKISPGDLEFLNILDNKFKISKDPYSYFIVASDFVFDAYYTYSILTMNNSNFKEMELLLMWEITKRNDIEKLKKLFLKDRKNDSGRTRG